MSFSPLYGFGDFEEYTINKYKVSTATSRGKIVYPIQSTGTLSVAADYGYFLLEEVTSDGVSYEERQAGIRQWEVIVDYCVAVSDGSAILSCAVVISAGIYCTDSDAGVSAIKGIIVATPTETGIDGVYDIQIRNATGYY